MSAIVTGSPAGARLLPGEFRYPPVDPGLPALEVSELLDAHQQLIDRIKLCFGMDRQTFDDSVRPLLQRYASYVHLLPCTADNYFNEPGGLLRLGLETAFFALQGSDAHIFSGRATITERRHLEPRWRQATFIGGLCCELHRPLSQIIVTDEAGNEWSPFLHPLSVWLQNQQIHHYFFKWRPNAPETRALGLFTLPHVVSAETLQDLANGNTQIVPHLLATIAGQPLYRDHNVLETLVRRSSAVVIDRFLLANAERYGKPQLGSHLERYLIDALRRLAATNPSWVPNAEKSRVWHGSDGMFLVWPASAEDIRKLLEADQLPGIPKAPETILEVLLTAGVLAPNQNGSASWRINPPGSKAAQEAVKLSAPALLYAESDKLPATLPVPLVAPPTVVASATGTEGRKATAAEKPPPPSDSSADEQSKASLKAHLEPRTTPSFETPSAPQPTHQSEQLSLLDEGAINSTEARYSAPPVSPAKPSPPEARPVPQLQAPLRLSVLVKEALAAIITTLSQEPHQWAANPMADGLFVPLAELAARKANPPVAIGALNDAGMLVQPSALTRQFQGEDAVGILIDCKYVTDLLLPCPSKTPGH